MTLLDPAPGPGPVPIALHPERTDDERTLRWWVRHTLDPAPGRPPPEPLDALIADGVLAGVIIDLDRVDTTLAPGRSWSQDGAVVRAAVQDAVRRHDEWLDAASQAERDAVLARVAREVAEAVVAPVATAHGGRIEVLRAQDGVVLVQLAGACHGCPAAASTLHQRLEHELRQRLPWLQSVHAATPH